jgi:hypothetical protein
MPLLGSRVYESFGLASKVTGKELLFFMFFFLLNVALIEGI